MVALPSPGDGPWTPFLRVLIGELAVLELLHGYPVAGIQPAVGALPLVLAGGICVGDGLKQIGEMARPQLRLAAAAMPRRMSR